MKRFSLYFLYSLFTILILASCDKDKDKVTKSDSEDNNPPAGEFSATVGNETFNGKANYARYRTTGELAIVAKDENGTTLKFIIGNFIGNSTYPLNLVAQNLAEYEYIINGNTVRFSTQEVSAGSIEITGYNSGSEVLNGSFDVILTQQSGSALVEIHGEFSDVPIVELKEPSPGEAAMYFTDEFYKPSEISAIVNNLRYFVITMDGENMPNALSMHRPLISADNGYLDYGGGWFPWQRASSQTLPIFTYNEDQKHLTGKVFSNTSDMEIWFNEIEITSFPYKVEVGEFALLTASDTIYFDQASYTRENGPITYTTIEATNQAGNRVLFETEYDNTNPDYNLYPSELGTQTVLKFYENESNSFPTFSTVGHLSTVSGLSSDKVSVYFLSWSTSDANFSQVVSNNIDYIN